VNVHPTVAGFAASLLVAERGAASGLSRHQDLAQGDDVGLSIIENADTNCAHSSGTAQRAPDALQDVTVAAAQGNLGWRTHP
jgi:hypothetical protein